MILVIGDKGNMGQRYKACLNFMELENDGFDINVQTYDARYLIDKSDSIIIATPTDTHYDIIKRLYDTGCRKPVLCEKPICKELGKMRQVEEMAKAMPITMVFQYMFMDFIGYKTAILRKGTKYQSYYNYFKHGTDGINWDCIQLINMAENKPLLLNDSPTWNCIINGFEVDRDSIDRSYLKMIEHWLENPGWNFKPLYEMHEKAANFV